MFFGYNTNGLAHHDLFDAVELLAEIGYRGVAITIDHNALPPGDSADVGATAGLSGSAFQTGSAPLGKPAVAPTAAKQIERLRTLLEKLGMRSVVETGARFLLDPRAKHEPTLLSAFAAAADRLLQVRRRLCRGIGQRLRLAVVGEGDGGGCRRGFPAGDDLSRQPPPSPWPAHKALDRLVAGLREVLEYGERRRTS